MVEGINYACLYCKRAHAFSYPPKCDAFPKGIPSKILDGKDWHSKPVRGDNGTVFEPKDEELWERASKNRKLTQE